MPGEKGEAGGRKIMNGVGGVPVSMEGVDVIGGVFLFLFIAFKAERGCRLPLLQ